MVPPICPSCGQLNPPESKYCSRCGSLLITIAKDSPEQHATTEDEIQYLRELAGYINTRLDTLESKRRTTEPPETQPAITPPISEAISEKQPTGTTSVKEAPTEVIPIKEKARGPRKPHEWEQILGGSWLARIGVLALIIGVGFFLKYAFDNDWIGPTTRVILGGVVGIGLLWLGNHWRRRYPIMTQVLSGGGVAIFYLSVFASFSTYHLISIYFAVVLLLFISAVSTILALRYNSAALAVIGVLGAYFAPFILGAFSDRTPGDSNTGQAVQLLIYIIVISIGALVLSTFRNWRWFTLIALVCSLVTYMFWYSEFQNQISLAAAETGLTVIFLIFAGATSLFHLIRKHVPEATDYTLMFANASIYYGLSLYIMWDELRSWMGGFTLLLAIFYGLLSYISYKRNASNSRLGEFSLAIALFFLTAAIPIQFGDNAPTTIAWAIEMCVLIWMSFKVKLSLLLYAGYLVFILMAIRLLIFDTRISMMEYTPVLNERFLAFIIGIGLSYLAFYFLWQNRKTAKELDFMMGLLLIAVNFLSLWIISFEVWGSFSEASRSTGNGTSEGLKNAQNLALTGVWAVYAVAGLIIGIWRRWRYVRIGALILLAVPIIKVFVYDVFKLELGYRIGAFIGLGVLLLVSAYLYQRYSKKIRGVLTKK